MKSIDAEKAEVEQPRSWWHRATLAVLKFITYPIVPPSVYEKDLAARRELSESLTRVQKTLEESLARSNETVAVLELISTVLSWKLPVAEITHYRDLIYIWSQAGIPAKRIERLLNEYPSELYAVHVAMEDAFIRNPEIKIASNSTLVEVNEFIVSSLQSIVEGTYSRAAFYIRDDDFDIDIMVLLALASDPSVKTYIEWYALMDALDYYSIPQLVILLGAFDIARVRDMGEKDVDFDIAMSMVSPSSFL